MEEGKNERIQLSTRKYADGEISVLALFCLRLYWCKPVYHWGFCRVVDFVEENPETCLDSIAEIIARSRNASTTMALMQALVLLPEERLEQSSRLRGQFPEYFLGGNSVRERVMQGLYIGANVFHGPKPNLKCLLARDEYYRTNKEALDKMANECARLVIEQVPPSTGEFDGKRAEAIRETFERVSKKLDS